MFKDSIMKHQKLFEKREGKRDNGKNKIMK
jgi:hypothetical protein